MFMCIFICICTYTSLKKEDSASTLTTLSVQSVHSLGDPMVSHVHIHGCICVYLYIWTCIRIYTVCFFSGGSSGKICMYICICVYMCMNMYVYEYVYMYMYICYFKERRFCIDFNHPLCTISSFSWRSNGEL
jgi:hypothetical protein